MEIDSDPSVIWPAGSPQSSSSTKQPSVDGRPRSPSLLLFENIPSLPPPKRSRAESTPVFYQQRFSRLSSSCTSPRIEAIRKEKSLSSSELLVQKFDLPISISSFIDLSGSVAAPSNLKVPQEMSATHQSIVSPHSFLVGVAVGVALVFLRPTIEFYMDAGARFVMITLKYLLIWGSMAGSAWGVFRIVSSQTNEKQTSSEQKSERHVEKVASDSVSIAPHSPPKLRKKSSTDSLDEKHSYRPYPAREALKPVKSSDANVYKHQIFSGEDISMLEKPVGQDAFRLPRKGPRTAIY
jgi:hypothetical protein